MQQLAPNLIVLNAGEQFPPGTEDFLKIYLAGTQSIGNGDDTDWQTKFANGLLTLVTGNNSLIMYKNTKFMLINPKIPVQNPKMTLDNPEFVQKLNWEYDMMGAADAIFVNFLKKSVSPIPLLEFGYALRAGKTVVRCPEEYQHYGMVRLLCEKHQVPLHQSTTGTVLAVLQSMFAYVPRFQEINRLSLPE